MTLPNSAAAITVVEADLTRPAHQEAVIAMIDAYARDPMGDGTPLDADVRARLIPGLRAYPTTLIFLAFDRDQAVGIAVCFIGFSTFAAKRLVNIHDFAVLATHRGRGVSRQLLDAIEVKARQLDCCKLTLEVLENNRRARRVYEAAGFARYELQPEAGGALFLSKPL
jgi:GNAT superfamily N-acetyltransferase